MLPSPSYCSIQLASLFLLLSSVFVRSLSVVAAAPYDDDNNSDEETEEWKRPKQLMSYSEGPSAGGEDGGLTGFIVSAWDKCSASCGPGIRSRLVECMAAPASLCVCPTTNAKARGNYENAKDDLKKAQCAKHLKNAMTLRQGRHFESPKINKSRHSSNRAIWPHAESKRRLPNRPFGRCPNRSGGEPNRNGTSTVFRWEHGDWTKCSASCSGSKQRSPVICVDTVRRVTVAWTNCDDRAAAGQKPQELVRRCNRHSCTPDWEIGPWSACSHACGGGLRTRRVRCVRTASGSGAATATLLMLPDGQCPGAPKFASFRGTSPTVRAYWE
ncbi:hypothetical protein niasHT_025549 [Heterodera trifolii]|uniref:Uncharacterized protein n=1 Tax=Heterodera trifolii TaxID=157864 RepID=A0ABD2K873_9BILA